MRVPSARCAALHPALRDLWRTLVPVLPGLLGVLALALSSSAAFAQGWTSTEDPELDRLLAEERLEADRLRRRGDPRAALRLLDEHLDEDPADVESRYLRARVRFSEKDLEGALADAELALEGLQALDDSAPPDGLSACARLLAKVHLERGHADAALEVLDWCEPFLRPGVDARDDWTLGTALLAAGQRERALEAFGRGGRSSTDQGWEGLLARGRCLVALRRQHEAARALVLADAAARELEGPEPDVLVALGELYFEYYREIEDPGANERSSAELYREALSLHPTHEGALLGLFTLHRFNWNRRSRSAHSILGEALENHPRSIAALLAGLSMDLADGRLVSARERLALLEEEAPRRRDVRTEKAALAWIEHGREHALALLEELAREDPGDGRPEREVGRHLIELYRFSEARPFLEASVKRDPRDPEAWTLLGRSLANTGDEEAARAAFERAAEAADGGRDAWRENMALVLRRIEDGMVEHEAGDLTFVWRPDAAAIFETYMVPHYEASREDLARRYGHTPGPVRIEVFRQHRDFSIRSTGFEGFPATGVCFGPVVTAVSPLAEMRGAFSWARTSFHEFSHVVHLGLSHNRCPRWITEGLATWEEVAKDPRWTRNMRRDLHDARANQDVIPVRELNRAFRGPRIAFGYYQGGLLCRMLIDEFGFQPMVRLLEAFDRGLDLDQAFDEVFGITPEAVDERFSAFVDEELAGLSIEPRWNESHVRRLRLGLSRKAPTEAAALERWREGWATVAWSAWQHDRRVDAEEALRTLQAGTTGEEPPRALFLRGVMAMSRQKLEEAMAFWERGFAAGGEDYAVRMALGRLFQGRGELDEAIAAFEAARDAFPGYPDASYSAELELARALDADGRPEEAMATREAWLAWNAADTQVRLQVAAWHEGEGRFAEAEALYREVNEVDPFLRSVHRRWGEALVELGRLEEAEREFRMALAVPRELDAQAREVSAGAWRSEEAELLGLLARTLLALEREDEARSAAEAALTIEEEPIARQVLEELGG